MWQTIDVWINNSKPSMSLHVCIQLYTLIPYIPIVTAFTIDQITENGKMLWNCNSVILCVWNWIASKRTRYTGNYSFSYNEVNENELVGCKCNEYAFNILFRFLSILLISPGFFFTSVLNVVWQNLRFGWNFPNLYFFSIFLSFAWNQRKYRMILSTISTMPGNNNYNQSNWVLHWHICRKISKDVVLFVTYDCQTNSKFILAKQHKTQAKTQHTELFPNHVCIDHSKTSLCLVYVSVFSFVWILPLREHIL